MNISKEKKVLLFIIFSVFLFLAITVSAAGTYFYKSIDVDIKVNQDSTFDVIENQTYSLNGNFGYFYRDIKLKNLDHISDIEVFDGNGEKLNKEQYKVSYKGSYVSIRWDFDRRDFNNELKSWVVKYRVHGGIGFYNNYDELYWNAIFADDRTVPVEYGQAIVHLPKEFSTNEIQKRMFIGSLNSKTESSNYEVIDNKTVKFWGNNISSQDFMTIVVAWPKGAVVKPILYRNQIINWLALFLTLAIPVFVFLKTYSDWRKTGKDEKINKTIIAHYEPVRNLSPALMGALIKQNVSIKEILATVIDLAVRGYLRIKEEENKILFFKNKEYVFEKLKEGSDLKTFEKEIMESLFGAKAVVFSSDLKNKFYKHIPKIKELIFSELEKSTNYFNGNIEKTRVKYSLRYSVVLFSILSIAIVLFIIAGVSSVGLIPVYVFLLIISLLASAIIALSFAHYMPALTREGAEAKWHSLGFREYLHTAERFRIGAETLDTFSKLLPYAMIFGVEKEWAKRFSDFSFENQNWYVPMVVYAHPGQPSSVSDFSSSFSSFASSLSSTFSSSPGGGSGMGGGGGAGGGGGGGGGGAG